MSNERISSTGRVLYPWEVTRGAKAPEPVAEVVEVEDEGDED